MKLRTASATLSIVFLLVLSANALVMMRVKGAYDSVVAAHEHRRQATTLTDALRQETEQLARLVRAYTVTGEPRYLLYYYDILAIRNGEKPVPANFNPATYWDAAIAGRIQHALPSDGPRHSLMEQMRALGFHQQELVGLSRVLAATAAMNKVEQVAFAATQGLYDPVRKEFVSDGKPHLDFASKLVHGNEYNLLKADLSAAVENLSTMVDQRTSDDVSQATEQLQRLIIESLAFMGGTLLLVLITYQVTHHQVLKPIRRLSVAADHLAVGQYDTRADVRTGVEELLVLGRTLDSMAQSIEDDIRARATVQKELEAAWQQAENATRAKSMFLANMSHEIRTPMNAIIGMAYLALKTELTPRQQDYVTNIHNAAKSLLGIINDILDFSKVEAGKLELEKIRFRVEDVVANSLSLLRQRAQEKEIELLLDIPDPLLLGDTGALLGDPLRLGQVLNNLLSNSVKFTHHGYVRLAVAFEQHDDDNVTLLFTVQDTGIGMNAGQIDSLFQEFTQADGSTTRQYGGTGLGLSISKRLIDLMGGRIWVESEVDVGSRFMFTAHFPIAKPLPPVAVLPGADSLRVLVVDDQAEARQVLAGMLSALGVGTRIGTGIEVAASALEALVMVDRAVGDGRPYDLLLLDWVMPDMDGGTLLKVIMGRGSSQTQLVVVSAYDSEVMHEIAKRFGVNHFLAKPVLPDALRHLVSTLTGHPMVEVPADIQTSADSNLQGMRVLLVEDNQINQQLAVELMKNRGITVDVVNHGQEALDRLAAMPVDYYHVVLMDLQMPVMDGYEATRHLRSDPRYYSLPIVAMTAHAMADERARCLAIGMNGHISKPIEPDYLYATLSRFFREPGGSVVDGEAVTVAETTVGTLPVIDGLDTAEGLRRAAGMPDLYLQVLSYFAQDYAGFGERISTMLAQERWTDLQRDVHTLKGLAGTIGAPRLQAEAVALEAACVKQDTAAVTAALPQLLGQLLPLIEALRQQELPEVKFT
ncbi:hypothetical protein DLREEDagrD3_18660 [Denitratisoma sp. agr-D3]